MKNKRFQIIWRYGIISTIISIMAMLIVGRAVRTTVIDADKWNSKADSTLSRVFMVQPKRGEILAADGSVLATNLTAYTICLDYRTAARREKQFIEAIDSLCDSLAAYYPVRTAKEWKMHLASPLSEKPEKRKQSHVILKDANYADYLRILKFPFFKRYKKKYSHGLHYTTKEVRVMPYGSMARRSIGRCNYINVPRYQDSALSHIQDDALHGYSGIEASLDTLLYGRPGTAKYVQLTHGVRSWVDTPPVNGYSVKTTLDINIQDIVESELQSMLQTTQAEWGTCILMEVATGDIKAISNLDRDKNGNYIEAMNYAMRAYEPGSVMKPISMIVALEDGYAFPLHRMMSIGSSYTYGGGAPIHDTHSPAELPVSSFIEYSSNIGMTKLIAPHYENNLNGFRERLRDIGFFDRLNTGMADERPPYFPTLDPKAGGKVSLSRMTYGYSTMIPPLYTCAIYNAIANDGKFVRPRIIKEKISDDGEVERIPVSYVRDSIMSKKNAKLLRKMIYDVVYGEGGTAKTLRSDIVEVAGKTGTCRIAYSKSDSVRDATGKIIVGYVNNRYRLAFCGFYPYENPKYTCMVVISNPNPEFKGAATTSGQVVKNIALKMHARGMLNNHSELMAEANKKKPPVVYTSVRDIKEKASNATGITAYSNFRKPKTTPEGSVPDVAGMGLRDAVKTLEEAGYNVQVKGNGYAIWQSHDPGSRYKRGTVVTVRFSPD